MKRRSEPRCRPPSCAGCCAGRRRCFDRLLAVVSDEHAREAKRWPSSTAERRRECVKSLLAGEQVDHSELGYDLDGHHLALMAKGEGRARGDARAGGDGSTVACSSVCREEEPIWACWLGRQAATRGRQALRALGEDSAGSGVRDRWRARRGAHRAGGSATARPRRRCRSPSAAARPSSATPTSPCWPRSCATTSSPPRCTSSTWSRSRASRDGGKVGRETLRAYFAAERNISSTAAALGVDRRTVTNRIRAIEDLLRSPPQGLRDRAGDRAAPGSPDRLPSLLNPRLQQDPILGRQRTRVAGEDHLDAVSPDAGGRA